MARSVRTWAFLTWGILILVIGLAAAGCGGGSSAETSSGTGSPAVHKTLGWTPPTSFADGTPLNPLTDLYAYEIYVKTGTAFYDSDTPMAYVAAIDPSTGRVVTNFDLSVLSPYLTKGNAYNIAIRAVTMSRAKSPFSGPANFTF